MERSSTPFRSHACIASFLCLGLLCLPLSGQDTPPRRTSPPLATERLADGTVGIVMGKAIAYSEVEKLVGELVKQYPDANRDALFHSARSYLARNLLLAQTAKRYAKDISDEEVIYYGTEYRGQDLQTVKEKIDLFREYYQIFLYLEARMGRTNRLKGVSPDFADHMRVTPREIREAYKTYCSRFQPDAKITLAQFLFPRQSFPSEKELLAALDQCRSKVLKIGPDAERLNAAALDWPGVSCKILDLADGGASLREPIRPFVRSAQKGDVSEPIDLGACLVIECLVDRSEATLMDFDAFQEKQLPVLINRHRERIENEIVMGLIQDAEYAPPDLFKMEPGSENIRR